MKTLRKRKHSVELADVFNDWTVIAPDVYNPERGWTARCRCWCGAERELMVRLLVTGKTKSCGCGRVRGSEKAMKQLRQIWLNLPRGEMDWMNVYEFHRWALREGYKTNAVMKKHDETKRYSPHNVYWDPKRKPAGRKRQQNNS